MTMHQPADIRREGLVSGRTGVRATSCCVDRGTSLLHVKWAIFVSERLAGGLIEVGEVGEESRDRQAPIT